MTRIFVKDDAARDAPQGDEASVSRPPAGGPGGRPSRAEAELIPGRILEAAKVVFLREGFEKTSMDTIAADAGMSKRTLYTRFPSKADLFVAVVHNVIDFNMVAIDAVSLVERPLLDALTELAGAILETVLVPDMVGIERIVMAESRRFPELANRLYVDRLDRLLEMVIGLLRDTGGVNGVSDEDLRRDAMIYMALVILPPMRDATLWPERDPPGEPLLRRSVEIFVHGALWRPRE